MHPADIKAELHKRGKKPARVAASLRVQDSTVSQVIHGRRTSRRIAQYIARVIGRPITQIWPGRYDTAVRGSKTGAK